MNLSKLFFGKPKWEEANDRGEFRGGATQNLVNMFETLKAKHGTEMARGWIDQTLDKIYKVFADLTRLPAGANRARVTHARIDKIIASAFRNDPDTNRIVCVNCPIIGACCHTQVDITDDESALLAELVQGGINIDMERLRAQAAVPDVDDSRADEWRKLTYEERACVFLDDKGMCRVYKDRPDSCRKWFVVENPPTCADYDQRGMTYVSQKAEIVASAALNLSATRGRLPAKLLKELQKK